MRFSVAQLNYHIGNFTANREKIRKAILKARDEKSDLVIFSELSLPGYPPLDLLQRDYFLEECRRTLEEIAGECRGITAIVGSPADGSPGDRDRKFFNSALALSDGKILFSAAKTLFPDFHIFDEHRYFRSGRNFSIFPFKGFRMALTIGSDLWYEQSPDYESGEKENHTVLPMDELAGQHPDFIVNISAFPFSYTKTGERISAFRNIAAKHGIPVINCNQTGANTELIFDGASVIINGKGGICCRLPFFEEEVRTFGMEEIFREMPYGDHEDHDQVELVRKALVCGIHDYFRKSGISRAVLGLSGGLDSAVVLCLAAEALGNDRVQALLMPSRYSSEDSTADAITLAERLNIPYNIINIEKSFRNFEEDLAPLFGNKQPDVTEENIQARIRALLLMAVANKSGSVLLNTSNKSEAAVGYGTMYGDMAGGLSVIGDVYKTDVYRLARHINRNGEIIPENTISRPPSAELRTDQLDTDSLPEYSILDPILYQYIEERKAPGKITGKGITPEIVSRVIKMVSNSEYKRFQAPPVLRISSASFGQGRIMPLAAKY